MSQLFMRRPNLDDLPPDLELPAGFVMREYEQKDLPSLTDLMQGAFPEEHWTTDRIQKSLFDDPTVVNTLVIVDGNKVVASASARLLPDKFPASGYVHWVGSHPEYKGKRLGYSVSLAVLRIFKTLGCKDAVLETDDFRLAAIKIYNDLGFVPEHRHESHPERWARVFSDLLAAVNL